MPKRTWNPKKKKRLRKHGYLTRSSSATGRLILKRRRRKGRSLLSVFKKLVSGS